MKETGSVLGRGGHAELAYVHGVEGREVDAASLANLAEQRPALFGRESFAGQQPAQQHVGTARIDFGHEVNQKPGLRSVVRRVLVDAEKTDHPVDQVVEGGAEVGCVAIVIAASPAVKAEAIVLVFFERRRVEHAQNIFADFDSFDAVAGFSGGAPVEGVDVLQNGEHGFRGKLLLEQGGQVLGREVRLAEKNQYERVGMTLPQPGYLVGDVAVARSNFAQIFARHAIEPVDGGAVVAGGGEQLVKRSPFVAPVEVEPDALAQLVFVNLAATPFVEDVLVARKNGFDSQH